MFTEQFAIWPFLFAIALWICAAIVAAIDTAILSLRKSELQQLAEDSRSKKTLTRMAQEPHVYSYSLNLVRLLCETVAAMLIGITSVLSFHELWVAVVIAILFVIFGTFLLVGFSPRQFARAYAPQMLRYTAWIAAIVRFFFGGFARRLSKLGEKINPAANKYVGFRDEEQLLTMVDEATELDMLEEEDRELIHSVFEFGDTVVREVMVPRIDMVTIDSETTLQESLDVFLEKALSRLPVIGKDADEVLGILYLRDVIKMQRWHADDWADRSVKELLKPAKFIPESKNADDALKMMQAEFNHLFIIVDEYGGIAGLVTMEDLIEELVGEISDEYDREDSDIVENVDGTYSVSARLSLSDLGEEIDIDLADEDVDSVGGWFTKLYGALPEVGEQVRSHGLELTIERVQRRPKRILFVLVRKLSPEELQLEEDLATGAITLPEFTDRINQHAEDSQEQVEQHSDDAAVKEREAAEHHVEKDN